MSFAIYYEEIRLAFVFSHFQDIFPFIFKGFKASILA
jgi:hypothetical protein